MILSENDRAKERIHNKTFWSFRNGKKPQKPTKTQPKASAKTSAKKPEARNKGGKK
jgi:hypothetical protein